jgi:hypothetical protein
METESVKGSNKRRIVRTTTVILVADLIQVAISLIIGWPSVSGTALFFLGILTLFVSYGVEILFYGGRYVYMGRGGNRPSIGFNRSITTISEYDRYKIEEGGSPGSDLEKIKAAPAILREISISGLIAIILSFILPRL